MKCDKCGGSISVPSQGDPHCTNPECGKRFPGGVSPNCATCNKELKDRRRKYCDDKCRDSDPKYRRASNYARRRRLEEDFTVAEAVTAVLKEYEEGPYAEKLRSIDGELSYYEFCVEDLVELLDKCGEIIGQKITHAQQKHGARAALEVLRDFINKICEAQTQLWEADSPNIPERGSKDWAVRKLISLRSRAQFDIEEINKVMRIIDEKGWR